MWYQPDGALVHYTLSTKEMIQDLTPLDFFVDTFKTFGIYDICQHCK